MPSLNEDRQKLRDKLQEALNAIDAAPPGLKTTLAITSVRETLGRAITLLSPREAGGTRGRDQEGGNP